MLSLLLKDELRHLARTRVAALSLTLPLLATAGALFRQPQYTQLAVYLCVNVAGLLTGAIVATSLQSDLQAGLPVLFAVRPVPRAWLPLAKFLAPASLLVGMQILSLILTYGLAQILGHGTPGLVRGLLETLAMGYALAISGGAFALLVGVIASSALTAVLASLGLQSLLHMFLGLIYARFCAAVRIAPLLQQASFAACGTLIAALFITLALPIYQRRALR